MNANDIRIMDFILIKTLSFLFLFEVQHMFFLVVELSVLLFSVGFILESDFESSLKKKIPTRDATAKPRKKIGNQCNKTLITYIVVDKTKVMIENFLNITLNITNECDSFHHHGCDQQVFE